MDFELFGTKDEALAFIKGFKAADDRDLTIGYRQLPTGGVAS
jgi:hypothetical protein